MINLYKWTSDFGDKSQQMIAVGKNERSAKVYQVHKGYRMLENDRFMEYLRSHQVFGYDTEKTTYAKVQKQYGPAMTNLFIWTDRSRGKMIAVGSESQFEKVYLVRHNYRILEQATLGQLVKFNAIDPDNFKGPIRKKVSDIEKEYGPVRRPGQGFPIT